jgi:hypothetical protein
MIQMKNRKLILILTLLSSSCYPQLDAKTEIFNEIITHEISEGGFYIQCDKPKTYFDSTDIELEVPKNILNDLTEASNKSKDGIWDSELIKNLNYSSDFIKAKVCLTKQDVEELFKRTGKRQSVLSISDPIFDSKYEHCVVSVAYWNFTGSGYGHTYFLKKVYGVWVIISTYDLWMT